MKFPRIKKTPFPCLIDSKGRLTKVSPVHDDAHYLWRILLLAISDKEYHQRPISKEETKNLTQDQMKELQEIAFVILDTIPKHQLLGIEYNDSFFSRQQRNSTNKWSSGINSPCTIARRLFCKFQSK
jgi:hypothetical protein